VAATTLKANKFMEPDENINPDDQQDSSSSEGETNPDETVSEDETTPSEETVPYERFKEVIEEKNQLKEDLETLKKDVETIKSSQPEPEEKEPTTYEEVEERAVKKAVKQIEKNLSEEKQADIKEEERIEKSFGQLNSMGQKITQAVKKAVLTKMIETGNTDVISTYLEMKELADGKANAEQQKKEGFVPPSHKGTGTPKSGFNYNEIKGKSLEEIISESE